MRTERSLVHVVSERGRLRLTWTYAGKRYRLSTGIPDTPQGRKALQARIAQIERDLMYEEFDETLERYRHERLRRPPRRDVLELWQAWLQTKTGLGVKTLDTMRVYQRLLERCPYKTVTEAKHLKKWLLENTSLRTARQTLQRLTTVYAWAYEEGLVEDPNNPFAVLSRGLRCPRSSHQPHNVDPFTPGECRAIIQAYAQHPVHHHYAPLIQFLLLTGCRPSEALALRWRDIEDTRITFAHTAVIVRGRMVEQQGTKTQPRRYFPVNDELRALLEAHRPADANPDALVFPNPVTGGLLHYEYFLRSWSGYKRKGVMVGGIVRKLVEQGAVARYRSPYNLRHTAITLFMEAGVGLPQIAAWVGNSPEVILQYYAGVINQAQVPRLGLVLTDPGGSLEEALES